MKLITKSAIAILLATTLTQTLNAKTTICYKKDWKSPATIEKTKLDGGECQGNLSLKDMTSKGWYIKDIKIRKGKKEGLSYAYILTDQKPISIDNSKFLDNEYKKLQYKPVATKLTNVNGDTATINVGNLRKGQSGIVEHFYTNNQSQIIANAYVISSNNTTSKVKLVPFLDIKQNAIPTSNRKAANNDEVILNYMYNSSLLIAPSRDAFIATRKKYKDNNFLHSDLFGAYLKFEGEPLPTKEMIQEYAISQNLGTIFFVIGSNLYIVDSKTFAILDKDTVAYNFVENKKMPFYTRVDKIEKKLLNSLLDYKNWFNYIKSFVGLGGETKEKTDEEKLLEEYIDSGELTVDGEIYENYYNTILGLKK